MEEKDELKEQNVQEPEENEQLTQQVEQKKEREVKNFENLRLAKEKAERENEELQARLEALQKVFNPQQKEESENMNYGEDDLIEGRHMQQFEYKQQQQINEIRAQIERDKLEKALPDFKAVVNEKNFKKLKELDPEAAEVLEASNASIYSVGKQVYKKIKELGIIKDPDAENTEKAKQNLSKPRPLNSISPQQGSTPIARANEFSSHPTLTDEEKEYWRAEVNKYKF